MLVAGRISSKTSWWARDLVEVAEVGDEDTGPDDVSEAAAGLDQCGSDDVRRPPGLAVGAFGCRAIRVPADRCPDEDEVAYANRP
jgi:hypothetical protein